MKSKLAQFRSVEHLPLRQILSKMNISDEELLSLFEIWRAQHLIPEADALYEQLKITVQRRHSKEMHDHQAAIYERFKKMRKSGKSSSQIAKALGKSSERIYRFNLRWYKELYDEGMRDAQIGREMKLPDEELIPISQAQEEKRRQLRASSKKKKTANALYASFHMNKLKREVEYPEDYLIFDLEGIQDPDELIEIAVINLKGEVLMDTLVKPSHAINWRIAELTGITNQMVEEGQSIHPVMKRLKKISQGKTLMSWGTDYDKVLLEKASQSTGTRLNCNFVCAQKIHMGNHGLSAQIALHKALGEERQTHRALDDCRMVLSVLKNDLKEIEQAAQQEES